MRSDIALFYLIILCLKKNMSARSKYFVGVTFIEMISFGARDGQFYVFVSVFRV